MFLVRVHMAFASVRTLESLATELARERESVVVNAVVVASPVVHSSKGKITEIAIRS
jgi:hypothetical protein